MKTRKFHCIVRIDTEKPKKQHCWEVKIIRSGNSFHRTFSDAKYGGRKKALAAAIKSRDTEIKKRPAKSSYEAAKQLKKTNASGLVGVRRGSKTVRRGRKSWTYPAWIATGTPVSGEASKTQYFLVSTFGSSGAAKRAAIARRREWEASLRRSIDAKRRAGG